MPAIERPFFLVGSERSGTTLLRLMLSHHPSIECAPEFEFLVEFPGFAGADTDVRAYTDGLATNRIFRAYGLRADTSLDFVALANDLLWQYCGGSGKPIIGATCHKHFDRLKAIWPRPRYVHLLRDGRDVARSCVQMGWAGNAWYGVDRWVTAERLWDRIVATTAAEDRIELTYEDLILAPERELGRVCEFLGTRFDPKMMEYASKSTYERPDPKLVQQWRKKLSPRELALLEGKVGPLLRARGYQSSGVDALLPGPVEQARLRVEDKVGRLRFRLDRYGPANLVALKLAKTFGPRAWARAMTLKLNEIDNQHLR
jgi:hypothetical protein